MKTGYKPLTPATWADFVELFGEQGAYGGCWCMYWRQTRKEFSQNRGVKNQTAMKTLVDQGIVPGILIYRYGRVIAWISIAPYEQFPSLERSLNLKRIDKQSFWSIVCFYALPEQRTGILPVLIDQAIAYAQDNGARIVEAYPSTVEQPSQALDRYMGSLKAFLAAGFSLHAQAGSKLILRKYLD